MSDVDAIARGFVAAREANEPYEAPSAREPLDIDRAYAVQRAFNELRRANERVAGFKAAAKAEALQHALGLTQPITGMLFARGERVAGCTVARSGFRPLLIETELGFRAARRINVRVNSLAELRNATTVCMPMIELADPGFGRARMYGHDLIASNTASSGFICGLARSAATFDVNNVRVRLSRDGETLHEARSGDLLGDQWQALLWLVNTVVERGYVIEPGHLLMTGALGSAHPGAPGKYAAEFSGLATLTFEVV